jgi:protein-S-isoprenylcysteine O-methyltransferase Ste14
VSESTLIVLIHQIVFQGMFFAKNVFLRIKLGVTVRGRNREANISIVFFVLFIIVSFFLAEADIPFGTVGLISRAIARAVSIALLAVSLLIETTSFIGLGDSWRVGVLEDQETVLVEAGIYRFSRNPFFLSYLVMFAAYTILMQNIVLLVMSLVGFALTHAMVLKEEKHLSRIHGEKYRRYMEKVPRYILF